MFASLPSLRSSFCSGFSSRSTASLGDRLRRCAQPNGRTFLHRPEYSLRRCQLRMFSPTDHYNKMSSRFTASAARILGNANMLFDP